MKKTLKLMLAVVMASCMMACGEKKLTQEDLKAAEATLFNEDRTMNEDVAPGVAEKYCKFVEQNPEDPTSPTWLFHAIEINWALKENEKCMQLCNQLVDNYPSSNWAPNALIYLGSFIYEDRLNDTAQAHKAFQKLIDNYPDNPLAKDAQVLIECLGLTDEEKLIRIQMSKMPEEKGEW